MVNTYEGVDEIRNSAGLLFAPLGFGYSGEWERVTRREVSASSQEDFVWDETVYDVIEIEFINITFATNGDELSLLTSSNGGSSFDTGASDYQYVAPGWRNQAGAIFEVEGNGNSSIGFLNNNIGNASGEASSGTLKIFGPGDSSVFTYMQGQFTGFSGNPTPEVLQELIGAARTTNGIVNAVRISTNAASTYSGVIIVRGLKKNVQTFQNQDDWVVISDEANVAAAATHDYFWDDQVYDEIEISLWGVLTGTDDRNVECRLSSDGSTFHSGATDYQTAIANDNTAGAGGGLTDSNSGAAQGILIAALGTAADELFDCVVHLTDVSGTTRKKKLFANSTGISASGVWQNQRSSVIDMNTNNSCRGIQLRGELGATMAFDRVRIRGRRLTPIGAIKQDWELIQRVVLTANQATIPFVDIPAYEFDEFELTIKDADTDTTSNSIGLQFSANNGSSYDTGANYERTGQFYLPEAADTFNDSLTATSILLVGQFGSTTNRLANGQFMIGPLDSTGHKVVWGTGTYLADGGEFRGIDIFGDWEGTGSTGVVTAFQLILINGGNFTAGSTFTLRGRRKV